MSKKKKHIGEVCPICDYAYDKTHRRTRHHIFPRWWYNGNIVVIACSKCHQKEFHIKFPMKWGCIWSPSECVQKWVKFCKSKGKNAYIIYPELTKIEPLY